MKKLNQFLKALTILALLPILSCSETEEEDDEGNWIRKSYFEGSNRANSSAFSIDGRHFLVGGYTGDDYQRDLWEYDPNSDIWIRRADFPGTARANAVAFSIGQKGYYGTGYDGRDRLGDFWSYDPASDSWLEIASFPGTTRYNATGFSLAGLGFVGCGFDGSEQKDFWRYDPNSDSWSTFSSFGGAKRQGAFFFEIDNTIYLGGGINNGSYLQDFWALEGQSLTWTEKTSLTEEAEYTIARNEAVGFSLGSYGYVAVGSNGQLIGTTWEYIPSLDSWTLKTDFEGSLRLGASVFNANERAFVLLGRSSGLRFDDMYEFMPFDSFDEED